MHDQVQFSPLGLDRCRLTHMPDEDDFKGFTSHKGVPYKAMFTPVMMSQSAMKRLALMKTDKAQVLGLSHQVQDLNSQLTQMGSGRSDTRQMEL